MGTEETGSEQFEEEYDWEKAAAARLRAQGVRDARWQQSRPSKTSGTSIAQGIGDQIRNLFWGGVGLIVLGSILFFAAWPHSANADTYSGSAVTGSIRWSMFGLFINGVGGLLCSIACVAWGVSLGYRHAREKSAV